MRKYGMCVCVCVCVCVCTAQFEESIKNKGNNEFKNIKDQRK